MIKKRKCRIGGDPPSKPLFYCDKASMRGGLVKTKDGIAILVAFISMALFLFFGFFLGVITDSPKVKDEENNRKPQKIEKFIDWIIR